MVKFIAVQVGHTFMNVIGYARVSTDDQARDGVSVDSQIEKIKAYCVAKEWELIKIEVDEGISAKTLNRQGLKNVLNTLSKGKIEAVIIYKLDRLTRSVVDLNKLIEIFDKRNVAIVSVEESLDATSAGGKLMLNLLASVSQWEREVIGERTRSAMTFLKERKRVYSRPVFGYDIAEGQLTVNPKEQETIAKMRQLRSAGFNYRDIVERLNAEGVPTKRGGAWHENTVRRIILRDGLDPIWWGEYCPLLPKISKSFTVNTK